MLGLCMEVAFDFCISALENRNSPAEWKSRGVWGEEGRSAQHSAPQGALAVRPTVEAALVTGKDKGMGRPAIVKSWMLLSWPVRCSFEGKRAPGYVHQPGSFLNPIVWVFITRPPVPLSLKVGEGARKLQPSDGRSVLWPALGGSLGASGSHLLSINTVTEGLIINLRDTPVTQEFRRVLGTPVDKDQYIILPHLAKAPGQGTAQTENPSCV